MFDQAFAATTPGRFDHLAADALPSDLSGELVCSEIGGASEIDRRIATLIAICNEKLTERYAAVRKIAGFTVARGADDAVVMEIQVIREDDAA